MQQLHVTPDLMEADLIKSILESNGIFSVVLDKNIASVHPAVSFWTGLRIMVEERDYLGARKVLNDYLRQKSNSGPDSS